MSETEDDGIFERSWPLKEQCRTTGKWKEKNPLIT